MRGDIIMIPKTIHFVWVGEIILNPRILKMYENLAKTFKGI